MARSPASIYAEIRRRSEAMIGRLAEQVSRDYIERVNEPVEPIKKRGPRKRRRPNTVLITEAAQRAIVRRQLKQIIEWGVEHSKAPPYVKRQDFSQAIAIVDEVLENIQGELNADDRRS